MSSVNTPPRNVKKVDSESVGSSPTPMNSVDLSSRVAALEAALLKVTRSMKKIQKAMRKVPEDADGAPKPKRGFTKPVSIQEELANFLQVPLEPICRADVTRKIKEYIHANGLKDPKDGRIIHPDDKLNAVLGNPPAGTVTWFTLQRYLKHQYV
jgi:chromatin remodeling complex protein RSC6